jgi:hypothetical protein
MKPLSRLSGQQPLNVTIIIDVLVCLRDSAPHISWSSPPQDEGYKLICTYHGIGFIHCSSHPRLCNLYGERDREDAQLPESLDPGRSGVSVLGTSSDESRDRGIHPLPAILLHSKGGPADIVRRF